MDEWRKTQAQNGQLNIYNGNAVSILIFEHLLFKYKALNDAYTSSSSTENNPHYVDKQLALCFGTCQRKKKLDIHSYNRSNMVTKSKQKFRR